MVNGIQFTPKNGPARMVALIDFENPKKNFFRAVNQFTVEYTDNGQIENRRPDIVLFVNGMPLCIIELKNPTDKKATIKKAWEQINIRYWRDIPHLLHYCPLACISDGVHTKLGTVRTPFEHFYAWRRVEDHDKISEMSSEELMSMINGVYRPERFLEIFRDYIYFPDSAYDHDELEIVCRYPQFFAARLLKESIITSVKMKSGKGGTYFGATGCGKTFTMAFLARQLALRCTHVPEIGSPTIVVIVDRDELQKQGAKLFTRSKEFLNLGEVDVVQSRNALREELGARESGGFYVCTIQKFCDRENDPIGLINDRANIICFSDEAHRTQIEHSKKFRFSKDADNNMKALISKPYAKVLKEAFPQATFVGFTGTPIKETYQTFGDEIDRYTMDQAVADGVTVPIKYHPRIVKVVVDQEKARKIEEYYQKCAEEGATEEEIKESQKAMASMEIILGDTSRLECLAVDIHDHYTASCANDPGRVQKAMITCSSRTIAFQLLNIFRTKYPEWFVEKKTPDGADISDEEMKKLKPMPFMAMVASVGSNDEKELYDYLGGTANSQRSEALAAAFKQERSNFRIVIVVDMWLTGFDVPSLTYLYNDKPLQKHLLVQTISRVNRVYPGKEYGMIIDYIGIRDHMRKEMKRYGGESSVAASHDDAAKAADIFRNEIEILKQLFSDFDLSPLLASDGDHVQRYMTLADLSEYVFASVKKIPVEGKDGKQSENVPFKYFFLETVKRMRAAYAVCYPAGELNEKEKSYADCFMSIAGFTQKMSGISDISEEEMNCDVKKMVEEALQYTKVESILDTGEQEDVLSPAFIEKLSAIRMPASRLEYLIRMLRSQITDYGKTNRTAAERFQDMLEETIEQYHDRRKHLILEESDSKQTSEEIIQDTTDQAMQILQKMCSDQESFRKIGLSHEEKAFYDILLALRDEYQFDFGKDELVDGVFVNDKCKAAAKMLKEMIRSKATFADWLNSQLVCARLKFDIKICLIENGFPPQYTPEAFRKIMEQVENFEANR